MTQKQSFLAQSLPGAPCGWAAPHANVHGKFSHLTGRRRACPHPAHSKSRFYTGCPQGFHICAGRRVRVSLGPEHMFPLHSLYRYGSPRVVIASQWGLGPFASSLADPQIRCAGGRKRALLSQCEIATDGDHTPRKRLRGAGSLLDWRRMPNAVPRSSSNSRTSQLSYPCSIRRSSASR